MLHGQNVHLMPTSRPANLASTYIHVSTTHAPEIGAINRPRFLGPVFSAGFSYHIVCNENFWLRK